MIKRYFIVILTALFVWNCGNRSTKKDDPLFGIQYLAEYHNEYDGNQLIKTTIIETETYKNAVQVSKYEHIYEYSDGKLIRKNEFEIDAKGNKILQEVVNYTDGIEKITLNGVDTTGYEKQQYDSQGRLIHHIRKENISVPAFDFEIADNFEDTMVYDSEGKEIERTRIDLRSGAIHKELIFYDTIPPMPSPSDANIIYFHTIESGDTTTTKRYYNGELQEIFLEIKGIDATKELAYDADNVLITSQKKIISGNVEIQVTYDPELHATDSSFYIQDKVIKSVLIFPDHKTITLTEYDERGNLLMEKTILYIYKNIP